MNDVQLQFGAHLLLWGFPLALTILVAVAALRDRTHSEGPQ
jgi:cytochrome c-type biogenesis protein CcmH/NrfF